MGGGEEDDALADDGVSTTDSCKSARLRVSTKDSCTRAQPLGSLALLSPNAVVC